MPVLLGPQAVRLLRARTLLLYKALHEYSQHIYAMLFPTGFKTFAFAEMAAYYKSSSALSSSPIFVLEGARR